VFEVSAVTHRKDFIFPALVPWTADVDTLLSLAGGAELLGQLKGLLRGVVDLELTPGTCSFAAVIAVRDCPKTEVRRLIHLALGLDRRLKSADGGRRRHRHPQSARSGLGAGHPLPAGARQRDPRRAGRLCDRSVRCRGRRLEDRLRCHARAAARSSTRSPCRPPPWPGRAQWLASIDGSKLMKLVVGISGASGAIYGIRILEVLQKAGMSRPTW
jgi:hypothetical protein